MCYPAVACSHLCHCGSQDADVKSPRQGPEWRTSRREGDKRVGQIGNAFFLQKMLLLCVWCELGAWTRCDLEVNTQCRAALWVCSRPGSLPWQRLIRLCTALLSYLGMETNENETIQQSRVAGFQVGRKGLWHRMGFVKQGLTAFPRPRNGL